MTLAVHKFVTLRMSESRENKNTADYRGSHGNVTEVRTLTLNRENGTRTASETSRDTHFYKPSGDIRRKETGRRGACVP